MGLFDRFKKKAGAPPPPPTEAPGRRPGTAVKKKLVTNQTAATVETVAKPKTLSSAAVRAGQVLRHPLVTEKAADAEARGTYTFVVDRRSTKVQIRQAIKAVYGVTPRAVRISNVEGKRANFGQRRGKRADWKKALVTLPKGQTIRVHEGV